MTKEEDKNIDEDVLQWFSHIERMENDRIAKRVYVGECAVSRLVGRSRKRWIDTVKNFLKKMKLDIRQARRMVDDRSVRRGLGRGNAWVFAREMNP